MMDRRKFLKYMGVAGGAAALLRVNPAWAKRGKAPTSELFVPPPGGPPYPAGPYPSGPDPITDPSVMAALQNVKYTDPLLSAVPVFPTDALNTYNIQMAQTTATVSSALGNVTKVYAYGRTADPGTLHYPGFSFDVNQGTAITVNFTNNLPNGPHLLPSDPTIEGATVMATPLPYPAGYVLPMMGTALPENRATVHLHGGDILDGFNDGWPDWWTVPAGSPGITAPQVQTAVYRNTQAACCLWYHDHGMACTRLNVHAGLAGFYFIRDAQEMALNIPRPGNQPAFEVPLVIQDRMFDLNGQFLFPHQGSGGNIVNPAVNQQTWPSGHPYWAPEYFGDVAVVNGTVWPNMNVEARKYRFRLLNGCNARFLNLSLRVMDPVASLNWLPFNVIGSEQGFLKYNTVMNTLLMIPAARFDVIVDFSSLPVGTIVYLYNDGTQGPFPGGTGAAVLNEIMSFTVGPVITADTTVIPALPDPTYAQLTGPVAANRYITLNETMDMVTDSPQGMLIGEGLGGARFGLFWNDPVTITPKQGTQEYWYFINRTADAHPMHLHLVRFQVWGRFFINAAAYDTNSQIVPVGPRFMPLQPFDQGWKDTVIVPPGDGVNTYQVTLIRVPFPAGTTGVYPYHCHIIDHEDNSMMRYFQVVP